MMSKSMSKEDAKLKTQYQSMTAKEHIRKKPDTYIGAVEEDNIRYWSLNEEEDKFNFKDYKWVPGFYKCFDEAIVNARDHIVRMKMSKEKNKILVKNISVNIDKEQGVISIMNDGNGIDVAMHPKDKKWIPEMIFMHLRTSTNYDDKEKKLTGGKNGFGIKLVFIFAEWGEIETVDHIRKLKYVQRVGKNLENIGKPKITKYTGKPYTKVTWKPDYSLFGLTVMNDDMYNIFKKRTYDVAAVTDKSVKVKFNDKIINIKSFEQYVNMYIGDKETSSRVSESSERWECLVSMSPLDEFTQVSFVNGIHTGKGGKHVEYITTQICKKMVEYIKKKKKITVKPVTIKEQLMVFINCMIENPAFDSQTKDYMNTPISKFGSRFEISDKFIDKLAKMGVMDAAISLNEVKENKAAKKTDGRKSRTIKGVPKLIDANKAGTTQGWKCTLLLVEGDSAKAGVVSGLSKEDRDWFGIFPLKGKLLNVRGTSQNKINNNDEITNIKKIMGLRTGKEYKTKQDVEKDLRYGKIYFLTDQDLDGTHIKALGMNLFDTQWNDLFKLNDFIGCMITPIIKATKGKKSKSFYDETAYHKWKQQNNNAKGWHIKYYKGLGTSTSKEFKEYFKKKKLISFKYTGVNSDNAMDKAFNKLRADDRKEWLGNYDKNSRLDINKKTATIETFIDTDLIHFSKYDCERSIPNLIDGEKTSKRKILFSCFKRNLKKEIKVAQLSGYVSEHAAYHHGEMSLKGAIIGMAQEFVGSNNIALLQPNGTFGSRLEGGSDAASDRYIYTVLSPLTRYIFPEPDDKILTYLDDDGTVVEPEYYLPIIPMILINGGKGIGTGFSCEVLSYNVTQIVEYLKMKLIGKHYNNIIEPYYEGYKGKIIEIKKDKHKTGKKYLFKGKYKVISSDSIQVTELPVGLWTVPFKQHIESLMDDKNKKKKPIIKDYKDSSTDAQVDFTIKFHPGVLSTLISKKVDSNYNLLERALKLVNTKSSSNMYLFDENQKLKKYNSVEDIIDKYYPVRLKGYQDRKKYILQELENKIKLYSNKARFIKENCEGVIDLRKKKKVQVIELLTNRNYTVLNNDKEYKYLRTMTMDSLEEENMKKLLKDTEILKQKFKIISKTTSEQMWMYDLKNFEEQYKKYKKARGFRVFGKK